MSAKRLTSIVLALLLATAGLVVVSCSDDGPVLTGASPLPDRSPGAAAVSGSPRGHESAAALEDDRSDDDSDDDSSDDDSSDDDSSDDDSSDDDSSDDETKVRGLFFALAGCPATDATCLTALTVKDTLVLVTPDTVVENEPATDGSEDVDPAALAALLSTQTALGLMMTAEGVLLPDGSLEANELTIEDDLRAQGTVVSQPGCELAVAVRDITLCFQLADGASALPAGTEVRVEAEVHFDPSTAAFAFVAEDVEPLG